MSNAEIYELTLTPNYCSDWTFNDAVREFIQNGTDQEILDSRNKFQLEYDASTKTLRFINTKSKLSVNTLLLGRSSKSDNADTVGQFGEGYKIATLVLNRLNKSVTIYNNEKNEIWESRFKNSEKWSEKILAFYVTKVPTSDTGLVVEVKNVTEHEYGDIIENLWLPDDEYYFNNIEHIRTTYGDIILDEDYQNRIYVNGLALSYSGDLKYGYNFKPQYITLERDRKTCVDWDMKKVTSKMISEALLHHELPTETVTKMVEEDCDDIYQMDMYGCDTKNAVKDALIESFDIENNNDETAVPVSNQTDINIVKALGGKPVLVPHRTATILATIRTERINNLKEHPVKTFTTIGEQLTQWMNIYGNGLTNEAQSAFNKIVEKLK